MKLYSKFLKSPHFPSWFNKKRERAKRKCDKIIHKMIRKIKFERLVEGKPVREGIQMYQTIHRHMNNNNQSAKRMINNIFSSQLCARINFVFSVNEYDINSKSRFK